MCKIPRYACILPALTIAILINGSHARPSIQIEPKYSHVRSNQSLIIKCNSKSRLEGCQFHRGGDVLVDLKEGTASRTPPGYKYHGTGLQNGDCGLEVSGLTTGDVPGTSFLIGCRVRENVGGWVYDAMSVFVSESHQPLFFDSVPSGDLVVLPGQSVRLLHSLKYPTNITLKSCYFKLTTKISSRKKLFFNEGAKSKMTKEAAYFGSGLEHGDCGIKIFNVTEDINGYRYGSFGAVHPYKAYAHPSAAIIVAKLPEDTYLTLNTTNFNEGDILNATCGATNSRPVATITWYLGSDVIRRDMDDDSLQSDKEWRWSHNLQSTSQTISKRLTVKDDGKVLVCEIQNSAMKDGGVIREERKITVIQTKYYKMYEQEESTANISVNVATPFFYSHLIPGLHYYFFAVAVYSILVTSCVVVFILKRRRRRTISAEESEECLELPEIYDDVMTSSRDSADPIYDQIVDREESNGVYETVPMCNFDDCGNSEEQV